MEIRLYVLGSKKNEAIKMKKKILTMKNLRRNCKYPDNIIDFTFNLLFNMRSQINKQHMSVYVGHERKSQGQSPPC